MHGSPRQAYHASVPEAAKIMVVGSVSRRKLTSLYDPMVARGQSRYAFVGPAMQLLLPVQNETRTGSFVPAYVSLQVFVFNVWLCECALAAASDRYRERRSGVPEGHHMFVQVLTRSTRVMHRRLFHSITEQRPNEQQRGGG